ncbi:diguanylate cyclase [Jannaschia sp. LMIT008]|uniref:diguanylate cyclase n=1 Tax=Jannaschia maritima TaxID=3032585 RepID=UPI0028121E53|nr:diguanylate cyclase [Jannaschia sp. LMIT008]
MAGRILIVDDVATNRILMKVKLAAARYDVILASSGEEALDIARAGGIDVVIMDMLMPGLTGAQVCARLRADPATASIPVVLITATADPDARLAGLEAGADDFLSRPIDEVALLARVRALLRSREEDRAMGGGGEWADALDMGAAGDSVATDRMEGRIAILESDRAMGRALADLLAPDFARTPTTLEGDAALSLEPDEAPDLFLIDADFDGRGGGLRLLSDLRARGATRRAACVVMLPAGDSERAATALDLGASDVAYRPILPRELTMRLRTQLKRKRQRDRMRDALQNGLRMAVTDPLTGLYNRRYGLHHLERVAARGRQQDKPCGVIVLDLDHFKSVNDTHGHATGDRVLVAVAQALRDNLRSGDLVCRMGGEEFLAVLPDATLEQIHGIAVRLRGVIGRLRLVAPDGSPLRVTLSMGIAKIEVEAGGALAAVDRADRALYRAKAGGRDRIVAADATPPA